MNEDKLTDGYTSKYGLDIFYEEILKVNYND